MNQLNFISSEQLRELSSYFSLNAPPKHEKNNGLGVNLAGVDLVQDLLYQERLMVTDFHVNRAGYFTASELTPLLSSGRSKDAVMSVAGHTYICTKAYERLLGYCIPSSPSSVPIRWGNYYEGVALQKLGLQKNEQTYTNPALNVGATPDYVGEYTLDIKCPYVAANIIEYMRLRNPNDVKNSVPEYYWQVITQMFLLSVCGKLCFYDARRDKFNIIEFDINNADIKKDMEFLIQRLQLSKLLLDDLMASL